MLDARTAWAIVMLLAPTGIVAAGSAADVTVPGGHTAYVEIRVDQTPTTDLARVEARVGCMTSSQLGEALDWISDGGCQTPPGAAVYVTAKDAPSPTQASALLPTGTVYEYEDADRIWTVREYAFGPPSEPDRHRAYVLTPDISEQVDDDGLGEPVRGLVNFEEMGVAPGESIELETTLARAPQVTPQDPEIVHVDADETGHLPTAGMGNVRG